MAHWFRYRKRKRLRSLEELQKWLDEATTTAITDEEDLITLGVKLRSTPTLDDDMDIKGIDEDEG